MTFRQRIIGDVFVLTPQKNLVSGDETNALLSAIDRIAATRPAMVVMDLGEIKWVCSLGISRLRKASITCVRSGGWLRLARTGSLIENTLLATGLFIYFDGFDTVDAAVAAPRKLPGRHMNGERLDDRPKQPDV